MPASPETVVQAHIPQSPGPYIHYKRRSKKPGVRLSKLMLSTYFRIGITFLLLIMLFLTASFIAFQSEQKRKRLKEYEKQIPEAEIIVPNSEVTSIEHWTTFTNSATKLTFRYPQEATLLEINEYPENGLALKVIIEKVEDIEPSNLGYDRETSIQDRESLKAGEYGNTVDFDHPSSREVVSLNEVNGKSFTVLGRFDTCDYTFERKIIFYPDEYRVILTLYGQEDTIREEAVNYFSEKGCGGVKGWDYNNNAQERFYDILVSKQAPSVAQKWYNTFDQILSTLRFNSGQ